MEHKTQLTNSNLSLVKNWFFFFFLNFIRLCVLICFKIQFFIVCFSNWHLPKINLSLGKNVKYQHFVLTFLYQHWTVHVFMQYWNWYLKLRFRRSANWYLQGNISWSSCCDQDRLVFTFMPYILNCDQIIILGRIWKWSLSLSLKLENTYFISSN